MATCGEVLVKLLEAYGVELIFGIPGVHTVELYRGLPATRIRHITPRHEQGAGFMADGYARVTGKPGVCFIVTGPGMTNISTAMGQAFADSVPMLVISAVNARDQLGMQQGRLHELRSQQNLSLVSLRSAILCSSPEQLPGILACAFAVFKASGRGRFISRFRSMSSWPRSDESAAKHGRCRREPGPSGKPSRRQQAFCARQSDP